MKKWLSTLTVSLIGFGLVAVPSASAKSPEAQPSLVALGDSITFGYNLGINNDHPSKEAFPYIIGQDEDFRVRDLGVPGWTSAQLLTALQTDPKFQEAVSHADDITIDIGNNDLLQGLKATGGNPLQMQGYIRQMLGNLDEILTLVHNQSPHAKIVVYNIYNAFQTIDPLHLYSYQTLPAINLAIAGVAQKHGVALADAYGTFGEDQAIYVRLGDIHPTVLGQDALAQIGEKALGN